MSKYTTELRFICESVIGLEESKGYNDVSNIISAAIPYIFSFDFEIFDPDYRNVLLKKIIMHYYTREISEETYGLWKLRLEAKMNEIMPFYNQLYRSALLQFNPLYDVDLWTTHEGSGTHDEHETGSLNEATHEEIDRTEDRTHNATDDSTTNTSNSTSGQFSNTGSSSDLAWDLYSDTPQSTLVGLEDQTYLTTARKNTDSASNQNSGSSSGSDTGSTAYHDSVAKAEHTDIDHENNGTRNNNTRRDNDIDTTEQYTRHVAGKTPGHSYSKMLMDFRKTFLNIDLMVINELEPLFFGLW